MDQVIKHIETTDPKDDKVRSQAFTNVQDICIKDLGLPYKGRLFLSKRHTDQDMLWWLKHHQIKVVIGLGFKDPI